MEEKKFINPYNFVSFPQKKNQAYEETDCHTGAITYQIITRTPLFIPNTSNENAFLCKEEGHKSYDFFSYRELEEGVDHKNNPQEPVIPGSELRGMLRGIYETLTNSCMGVFNDELYPERRTGDVFLPGVIHRKNDGQYELCKAKSYQWSNAFSPDKLKLYPEGALVSFELEQKESRKGYKVLKTDVAKNVTVNVTKNARGRKEGYLIKGEAFGRRKKHCYIFVPMLEKVDMEFDKQAQKRLEAVLESYQAQPGHESYYKEYQKNLKAFFRGEGEKYFPVRYSVVEKKLLYLSPAAITKEIANTSLKDVLGEFKECETYAQRCPACDLFGMIGKNHEEAIGSKLRFSDARVTDSRQPGEYYDKILVRETLGGPKLSNPEFYLKRPQGATAWNYDYYIQNEQIHLYSKNVPLRLRGRKYYVHQPNVQFPKNVARTNLNATIRPVTKNVVFEGKVYFENISEKQINQLVWILNGGAEKETKEEKSLWYKLGSGKPLGFGSVELHVVTGEERSLSLGDETICYERKPIDIVPQSYEENCFGRIVKKEFMEINSPDYAKDCEVTYPSVVGGTVIGTTVEKGFEWFQINKGNGVSKRERSKIKTVLPQISGKYLKQYDAAKEKMARDNKSRSRNFK